MYSNNLLDITTRNLNHQGFKVFKSFKYPKSLLWTPDIIAKKDNITYFILIRGNNTISPYILERMSKIPKTSYELGILIVFVNKPNNKLLSQLGNRNIGFAFLSRNNFSKFRTNKAYNQKEISKTNKSNVIDIFISSVQDIDEREFVKKKLLSINHTFEYPIYPQLIEYRRYNPKKIKKQILEKLKECQWILIILEENHSDYVKFEIKNSFKFLDHKNIFIFKKNTLKCSNTWLKEINFIKSNETVKYIPYNDLEDLEVTIMQNILEHCNQCGMKNAIIK